ncbi:hypothetical protein QQF64_005694 [Cirrhinus molitorella]|uniref:Uncharacterized protein n=1 Tax=Cirrhinus molitorella TaxID=172907 RepID=A0ABR3MD05_9TELE
MWVEEREKEKGRERRMYWMPYMEAKGEDKVVYRMAEVGSGHGEPASVTQAPTAAPGLPLTLPFTPRNPSINLLSSGVRHTTADSERKVLSEKDGLWGHVTVTPVSQAAVSRGHSVQVRSRYVGRGVVQGSRAGQACDQRRRAEGVEQPGEISARRANRGRFNFRYKVCLREEEEN